ncbi:MAG: BamA/TamA family outer membrane protein [Microscillaceae bacterium]
MIAQCQALGYWEAQIAHWDSAVAIPKVYLKLGPQYTWADLRAGNLPLVLQNALRGRIKKPEGAPLLWDEVAQMQTEMLSYSENHGHPFATVQLDSIVVQETALQAAWRYEAGPKIRFDSLNLTGDARVHPRFLAALLNIRPGQEYDQRKISRLVTTLKTLPYLQLTALPQVDFYLGYAFPKLILRRRRVNEVNGIVGLLPNENPLAQRSLLLTGSFHLSLENLFQRGQQLRGRWERLQVESQRLELSYQYPVFAGTNIDLAAKFQLLRQDSSFVNRLWELEPSYRLGSSGRVLLNGQSRRSTLGEANLFADLSTLPQVSEVRFFSLGVGYDWNQTDDYFFPHRGGRGRLLLRAGEKQLRRNPFAPDSVYRGIAFQSLQVQAEVEGQFFLPFRRRGVGMFSLKGGYIQNPHLFLNELFRLGGLQNLRGHVENAFFASAYALINLEYQWYFEASSYLFLFYDQGILQKNVLNQRETDFPLGLGLGLNVGFKSGQFQLVYALGQSQTQTLGFSRSKIHFGLLSRF